MVKEEKVIDFSRFWNALSKTVTFVLILFLCFILGLFIGYVLLGHGSFWDVLNINTWTHIIDFVK